MFICYQWTCIPNNKKYVGVTNKSLLGRWTEHCYSADNGSKQLFHKAIRKYGRDAFEGCILDTTDSKHEVLLLERNYIKANKTIADEGGYNLTTGGEYPNISAELKQRLSKIALQRGPVSDDTRKKLSESLKAYCNKVGHGPFEGKTHSTETKDKISKKLMGRTQSTQTKEKRRGKNHWNAKRVSINNEIYETVQEASVQLNVANATLHNRIRSGNPNFVNYFFVEGEL